jgi:subtilisin family serine protease
MGSYFFLLTLLSLFIFLPTPIDSFRILRKPEKRELFGHSANYRDTHIVVFRSSSLNNQHNNNNNNKNDRENVRFSKKSIDKLYDDHGFIYIDTVHKDILPNYHIIVNNNDNSNNNQSDLFKDILKEDFQADWISSQIPRFRPSRDKYYSTNNNNNNNNGNDDYSPFEHIKNPVKKLAFERILNKFAPSFEVKEISDTSLVYTYTHKLNNGNSVDVHSRIQKINDIGKRMPLEINRIIWNIEAKEREFERENKPFEFISKEDQKFFAKQWHLHGGTFRRNPYGDTFSTVEYCHLNVAPVWYNPLVTIKNGRYNTNDKGSSSNNNNNNNRVERILGRNVNIAIVGGGVNYNHADLRDKFLAHLSTDISNDYFITYDQYTANPSEDLRETRYLPVTVKGTNRTDYGMPLLSQSHDTSVASIAVGSATDGSCGVGVAPYARFSSIRLLDALNMVTELQEALSLSYKCISLGEGNDNDENMIFVSSWGPEDGSSSFLPVDTSPLVKDAIETCVRKGRKGKGTIYVQAAGNGRFGGDTVDLDGYVSNRYVISVGSVNPMGHPTVYTEGGESLMVVAPSSQENVGISTSTNIGNFHENRRNILTHFIKQRVLPSFTPSPKLPIDVDRAYASPSIGGCTTSFGGTSASAPQIAGIIALMLEANPKLTWKDVQDILIRSSRKLHFNETKYSGRNNRNAKNVLKNIVHINTNRIEEEEEEEEYRNNNNNNNNNINGVYKGLVKRIQEDFYIFFNPPDFLEWVINEETQLHHSFLLGFGLPDAAVAVEMAKKKKDNTYHSITNEYLLSIPSHRVLNEKRFLYKNEPFGKFSNDNIVRSNEIGVWYIAFDSLQEVEFLAKELYNGDNNNNNNNNPNRELIIDHVELYINATFPTSVENVQLALCDYQKVCNLFLRGRSYDGSTIVSHHVDHTFTSVKHWGQRVLSNSDDNSRGWTIMIRNNYPYKYAPVSVHNLELRIYYHK